MENVNNRIARGRLRRVSRAGAREAVGASAHKAAGATPNLQGFCGRSIAFRIKENLIKDGVNLDQGQGHAQEENAECV